jgi:hypothetical protein
MIKFVLQPGEWLAQRPRRRRRRRREIIVAPTAAKTALTVTRPLRSRSFVSLRLTLFVLRTDPWLSSSTSTFVAPVGAVTRGRPSPRLSERREPSRGTDSERLLTASSPFSSWITDEVTRLPLCRTSPDPRRRVDGFFDPSSWIDKAGAGILERIATSLGEAAEDVLNGVWWALSGSTTPQVDASFLREWLLTAITSDLYTHVASSVSRAAATRIASLVAAQSPAQSSAGVATAAEVSALLAREGEDRSEGRSDVA